MSRRSHAGSAAEEICMCVCVTEPVGYGWQRNTDKVVVRFLRGLQLRYMYMCEGFPMDEPVEEIANLSKYVAMTRAYTYVVVFLPPLSRHVMIVGWPLGGVWCSAVG